MNYLNIREMIYTNQRNWFENNGEDLNNFKKYPYTCIKARIYIEVAALLVSILQHTRITANSLTLIYAFLGPISILLVYLDTDISYLIALLNFIFFKGFIDWSDGALARIKKSCTETGALLDVWGAHVNTISFHICIGIFLYNQSGSTYYLYSIVVIVYLKAIDIKHFSHAFLGRLSSGSVDVKGGSENKGTDKTDLNKSSILFKYYLLFTWILDERARRVDCILTLILIEYLHSEKFIISITIFILMVIGILVRFVAGLYLVLFNKKLG